MELLYLQLGFQLENEKNYAESYQQYIEGFKKSWDPLCAFKLGEYHLDQQLAKSSNLNTRSNIKALFYISVYQLLLKVYYGLSIFDEDIIQNILLTEVEKGIGCEKNIQKASDLISLELNMQKNSQVLYAFAHYQQAKLTSLLNHEQHEDSQKHFIQSEQLFLQRNSKENTVYEQITSCYYLGRINMIYHKDLQKADQYFQNFMEVYQNNKQSFSNVKTLQFEVLKIKTLKKLESFNISKTISDRILQQTNKAQSQNSNSNNQIIHNQSSIAKQDHTIESYDQKANQINIENQQAIDSFQITPIQNNIGGGQYQEKEFNINNNNPNNQSEINSLMSNKMNFVQNDENTIPFYDKRLIKIMNFLSKNEFGCTSEGVLLIKKVNEQQSLNIQFQSNSPTINENHVKGNGLYNMQPIQKQANFWFKDNITNIKKVQFSNEEKIIIKQFPFMRKKCFDMIFYHLVKMSKIKGGPGLLQVIGLSLNEENEDQESLKLMMVYPKIDYNLYAVLKQNVIQTLSQKLNIALQIAEALKNLHDNNVFHGNLKPTNILLSKGQKEDQYLTVYISDWEFTQKFNSRQFNQSVNNNMKLHSTHFGNTDNVINSKNYNQYNNNNDSEDDCYVDDSDPLYQYGYVSPEQLFQHPKTTLFSDIWSFGMLLVYLFFEVDLNQNKELMDKLDLYQCHNIKIANLFQDKINDNSFYYNKIVELIEKMIVYKPEDRWQIQKVRDLLIQLLMKLKAENQEIMLDYQQNLD